VWLYDVLKLVVASTVTPSMEAETVLCFPEGGEL
jgi:hypothetical protein